MRLGLQLGYDDPAFWVGLAEEAERCGFDSVWTSEAYGSDAVSPLAWIGGRLSPSRRFRLRTFFAFPLDGNTLVLQCRLLVQHHADSLFR